MNDAEHMRVYRRDETTNV